MNPMAGEESYPTECVRCGVKFKPGDTFWYDILDDIKGDMCGKCAHRVSFMEIATIPIQENGDDLES